MSRLEVWSRNNEVNLGRRNVDGKCFQIGEKTMFFYFLDQRSNVTDCVKKVVEPFRRQKFEEVRKTSALVKRCSSSYLILIDKNFLTSKLRARE